MDQKEKNKVARKRLPNQIKEGCPDGERRKGRPTLRWLYDIEADLR